MKTALGSLNILRFFRGVFLSLYPNLKKLLARPIFGLWKFLLRPASLLFYKSYLGLKKLFTEIYNPGQSKILSSLNNRYVVHGVIIILAIFVTINNINAKETRDETFGEKSIIYTIASQSTLGKDLDDLSITEKMNYTNFAPGEVINAPLSYLDAGIGVKSQIQPREIVLEKMLHEEAEIATAQGDSALVKPQISNTKLNQTQRDRPIEYIVEEGDTVSTIAQKFAISTNTILWENKLTAYSYIRPGDKLTILPVSGVSYTVKSGDNVTKIAKNYSSEEDKIITFNRLANASDIDIGQKLIVPGGSPPNVYVAPAAATSSRSISIPPSSIAGSGGKMAWPTSWRIITQYYSWRHTGLDIDGDYNSPIYASDSGVVESTGWYDGYGLQILINHGNGIKTRYAHSSKIFVSTGQQVNKGQTIAMVGTTGRSTGTHLHFEVIVNGRKQNPLSYIR